MLHTLITHLTKALRALALTSACALPSLTPALAQVTYGGVNDPSTPQRPPANSVGVDNAWYIDYLSGNVFGPKLYGRWPQTPVTQFLTGFDPILTGLATLNGTLNINALDLDPSTTITPQNLGIYERQSVTGTACTTGCFANLFNLGADNVAATGNLIGWYFNHNFGGSSATGNRSAATFNFLLTAPSGNVNVGASYGGLDVYAAAGANDNGTSSVPSGQIEAMNVFAKLAPAATNFLVEQSAEFDIYAAVGSSVKHKVGVQITQLPPDAVAGSITDAAFVISNGSGVSGWQNGILFGGQEGFWPFRSSSVAITCYTTCGTATSFIDMTNATFTGFDWSFAHASLTGDGLLTASSFVPTSSTPVSNGMYLGGSNTVSIAAGAVDIANFTATGLYLAAASGPINAADKFAWQSGATSPSTTFYSTSTATTNQNALYLGNSTSASEFAIKLNGGGFTGGLGANGVSIGIAASGANLEIGTGSEILQLGSTGMFTANGTTAAALTAIAPAGAHATVQEWMTIKDAAGTIRYIPAF